MKVLVVDDEVMLIEYLKRSLSADGYTVDSAVDGAEAYKKGSSNRYDAIVLDVIMPAKSGLEVCRELRDSGIRTPIIILSSRDTEEAKVEGLEAGADDYMIKPFGYTELDARLKALSRRANDHLADALEMGELILDHTSRKVTKAGKVINLRPKEYSLLRCLMLNEGNAVSKAHILHTVWGVSVQNASTRLQVCVKSLREKIGSGDGSGPEIKNIRGFGYIIE